MPFATLRPAARPRFPTAALALDAAREGEAVAGLGGTFFVLPAGDADGFAAGVPFARIRRATSAGRTQVVTVPAADDG